MGKDISEVIRVKQGLSREEIVKILNTIDIADKVGLEYILADLESTCKAFNKIFTGATFSKYIKDEHQEDIASQSTIDILPMVCFLNMPGLNINDDYIFFIDEEDLEKVIYERAIAAFGEAIQKVVAMEEMAELIQAISKSLREEKHNIEEEIADVEIMLGQLREMIGIDEELIREFKKEKLKRLDQMLLSYKGLQY